MDISGITGSAAYVSVFTKNSAVQKAPGNATADTLLGASAAPAVQTPDDEKAAAKAKNDQAIADFNTYMNKSTMEKYADAWLEKHGISKEQFDKMKPEEKQKLLAQMKRDIEQEIKEAAQKSKKPLVDFTV